MAEIRHSSHLAFDGPILRSIVHVLVEVTELRYVISRYGSDFLKKRGLHLLLLCASDTGMDAAVIQPALIAILPSDQ